MKTSNLCNSTPFFSQYSDEKLCELYRSSGNQGILVELLDRYDRYLISLCLPFLPFIDTVGDFKIELFLLLQKKLQTSQPENFKHWLGSVARRKMYDMMRKRRPKIMDELPERKLEIAEIWNLSLDFSLVIEAIENLKADQRLYIEMAFFLGYKQREICKELAWSTDKSRKVRQNAIRNLRKALGKNSSGLVDYLKTA